MVLIVDEMDTLVGSDSPIAYKAKPLVNAIYKRGRSAGVEILTAGQRGTVQNTGSKEVHANAGNKIVLRVERSGEMNNAVPDWMVAGMPDMASYAPGVKGVALVVEPGNVWRAGRVFHADDLDDYADLAQRRGRPTATLEPDIAAATGRLPHPTPHRRPRSRRTRRRDSSPPSAPTPATGACGRTMTRPLPASPTAWSARSNSASPACRPRRLRPRRSANWSRRGPRWTPRSPARSCGC